MACGAKEGAGTGADAKPAGPTKLTPLPLQAELPAGATPGKAIIGDGVMIQGGAVGAMTIDAASDSYPKSADDAKKEAEMYTPLNAKTEALPDGWILTFENKGDMGTNYWVMSRREIGGKAYKCETTASQASQQTAVVAVCKSLKP
jgi:hypothetical protein